MTAYVIGDSESLERIPIGQPIANTRIYILDRASNPVPIGVAGEIHVGGDGVARGYLHDPELTSQKFVSDPFGGDPAARLYATGDHGRFLPDGNIDLLGRVDDQIKIRGVRIELGEIEAAVRAHPSIQAAVITVAGTGGDERLIGYVVPHDGALSSSDLRRFVRERLPDHMVPSSFVLLDALPLTPNGKVDRRALPTPDPRAEREGEDSAARTPTEQALAAIMAEVLGLDRVGIHDNFFELGGHSLLGIRVVARVRKVFRVELPLRRLFEEPTVAGLALEVVKAERAGDGPVTPSPTRRVAPGEELAAQLADLSAEEVEALLGTVADLSAEEAEALLGTIRAKRRDERVTEEF